jgi:regulator of nucleoside diphosphate kinase
MRNRVTNSWTPEIIVGVVDFTRLRGLAHAALARTPELAEDLIAEMERATILDEAQVPNTVVRMGSEVEFESDDGRQRRRVTLVFPADADITQGKISVLTPIGTALIGLSQGQSIKWNTRDGREQELTVLAVAQAAVSPNGTTPKHS